MGYHTDFDGKFTLDKPLKPEHARYLMAFAQTRRQARNEELCEERPDPIRKAAGLPVGKNGAYFVGEDGFMGQNAGQPCDQPGPWCQWIPIRDNGIWDGPFDVNSEDEDWEGFNGIAWDTGEKFYYYVEWLGYIITHFLEPWGYTLNGDVSWDGEESGDIGVIEVKDNVISAHHGVLSLEQVVEKERVKNEKAAMVKTLDNLTEYLLTAEEKDFCENLGEFPFKEKDEDKACELQEELEKIIRHNNEGPEHVLSEIRKVLDGDPLHIYITLLEACILVNRNREVELHP